MTESIVPALVTIDNGDPGIRYAISPGHIGYACGDDGSIWSSNGRGLIKRWKRMHPTPSDSGHLTVKFVVDGRHSTKWCHILTLEAFVGPCPEGMECRHLNGIPCDNRLSNIEWNTRRVNTMDRKLHGNRNVFGEGHHMAIFTDSEVISMRDRARNGESICSIAASLGKSERAARKAIHGVTYNHLPGAVAKRKSPIVVTDDMVIYIREQHSRGRTHESISRETGVPPYVISRIVNRKSRASV